LRSEARSGAHHLLFEPGAESNREHIVLGALKSKRIDIVVAKSVVGPVLAISVKGTSKAFRNLVNRTEEAIGDCANIHLMCPGLVYGFVHFLKGTDPSDPSVGPNDVSLDPEGNVLPAIDAYARILQGLAGRKLLRDEYSRYEAIAIAILSSQRSKHGDVLLAGFPPGDSPLSLASFFASLYQTYDFRFPYTYTDPALRHLARAEWHPDSPAIRRAVGPRGPGLMLDYEPRVAGPV
jgi:hypothetical protein